MPQFGDYCTQVGPDGSGHDRCAPACVASILLSEGWESDPWELTLEITAKHFVPEQGATAGQILDALAAYAQHGHTLITRHECLDALDGRQHLLLLVQNAVLVPRSYPPGPGWEALHWIRAVRTHEDETLLYCYDPLTYLPQRTGAIYQGPWLYTADSVWEAVRATPEPYAGVVVDASPF